MRDGELWPTQCRGLRSMTLLGQEGVTGGVPALVRKVRG